MKEKYKAIVTSTGGRGGHARSNDNALNLPLSVPKELGGPSGNGSNCGSNPEQLFAAGYSACFLGAMKHLASQGLGQEKIKLSDESSVTAEVGIGDAEPGPGFQLAVTLKINVPNVELSVLKQIVEKAHQFCPYSRAIRNNVGVNFVYA